MSEATDALKAAIATIYRDYVVAGVPSSGPENPDKLAIINNADDVIDWAEGQLNSISTDLGDDLQAIIDGLAAGAVIMKETKALLDADLAHIAGIIAIVWNDTTEANNGFYKKSGGSGSGSWAFQRAYIIPTTLDRKVTEVSRTIVRRDRLNADVSGMQVVYGRGISVTTASETTGFSGWGIFPEPVVEDVADGFAIYLDPPATVASWDVLVVERPIGDVSSTNPGAGANDRTITDLSPTVTWTTGDDIYGITWQDKAALVQVDFAKPLKLDPAYHYAMLIRAKDGGGSPVAVGRITSNPTPAGSSFSKGWAWTTAPALVKITGLTTSGFVFKRAAEPRRSHAFARYSGSPVVSGLNIFFGMMLRHDFRGARSLYNVNQAIVATTGGSATFTGYVLKYYAPGTVIIPHGNINITQVRRQSDASVLTLNVDYYYYPGSGYLHGLVNVADFLVDVDYTWLDERVDCIAERPVTGDIVVRPGTPRPFSAHEDLYRGKPLAATDMPLFNLRVVGTQIMDVIPIHDWIGATSVEHEGELAGIFALARRMLPRTFARLTQGLGLLVAGYGDSIMTCGGGVYVDATSLLPNRSVTDNVPFSGVFYSSPAEADFLADWFAAEAAAGNTATINGATRITRGADHWYVLDRIREAWGYSYHFDLASPGTRELGWLNFGIGGSNADSTAGNMSNATRLAGVITPGGPVAYRTPDLVIYNPGMNDVVDSAYPGKLNTIMSFFKANDVEVLVFGPYFTATEGRRWTLDGWLNVHEAIRRAAVFNDCAYVPIPRIYGPENLGYMGLAQNQLTHTNFLNHPGPYEHRKMGEFLARVFDP